MNDVWSVILKSIDDKFTNHILMLLRLFPDKPWSWYGISRNKNIMWKIVQENPDKPWDWLRMSSNKFNC